MSNCIYPNDPIAKALNMAPLSIEVDLSIPSSATSSCSGPMNPFWGLKHTEETKLALRTSWANDTERKANLLKMQKDPAVRAKRKKTVQAWYDNADPEVIAAKAAAGLKSMNAHVACPHCGVKTNKGNIGRYHGDKCKSLNNG